MPVNARFLMGSCAAFLAVLGLLLTFAPHEVLSAIGAAPVEPMALLLQLAGASLVGWGLLNWYTRGLLIGGIYARPLTLGNFLHFFAGTCAIGNAAAGLSYSAPVLVAMFIYGAFAVAFGALLFGLASRLTRLEQPAP